MVGRLDSDRNILGRLYRLGCLGVASRAPDCSGNRSRRKARDCSIRVDPSDGHIHAESLRSGSSSAPPSIRRDTGPRFSGLWPFDQNPSPGRSDAVNSNGRPPVCHTIPVASKMMIVRTDSGDVHAGEPAALDARTACGPARRFYATRFLVGCRCVMWECRSGPSNWVETPGVPPVLSTLHPLPFPNRGGNIGSRRRYHGVAMVDPGRSDPSPSRRRNSPTWD